MRCAVKTHSHSPKAALLIKLNFYFFLLLAL